MNTSTTADVNLNADLHCHSTASDGTLAQEVLVKRAKDNGVQLWALTDHDEIAGLDLAHQTAQDLGLPFVNGVEISVSFAGVTVHIVGLGFDRRNPDLVAGLAATRGGRAQRARDMAAELAKVGIHNAYEGALKYVGNPDLISRTHFARHIVDIGMARDTHDVFRKYLADNKPGFVPHKWAGLGDAVKWITGAGGVAVIAHPARYGLSPTAEYALFSEFKTHGGLAVEVVTGSHSEAEYVKYADTAREFGLMASRGSDFHSPKESRIDLGTLPNLPTGSTPVWSVLKPLSA
jgi:predicted metal-dependent phosphoesterase TrpH